MCPDTENSRRTWEKPLVPRVVVSCPKPLSHPPRLKIFQVLNLYSVLFRFTLKFKLNWTGTFLKNHQRFIFSRFTTKRIINHTRSLRWVTLTARAGLVTRWQRERGRKRSNEHYESNDKQSTFTRWWTGTSMQSRFTRENRVISLFPLRMNFDRRPLPIHYRETSRLSEYYSPFIGRRGYAKLKFHLRKYTWRRIRNFANFSEKFTKYTEYSLGI